MPTTTKDYAKIGTFEYHACAESCRPAKEGEHADFYRGTWPNEENWVDIIDWTKHASLAEAQAWVAEQVAAAQPPGHEFTSARIDVITYDAIEPFYDETYGTIYDADQRIVEVHRYLHDGTLEEIEKDPPQ